MYDHLMRNDFKEAPQSVVAWLLMASFMYYIRDTSMLNDTTFDNACKWLSKNYDNVEHRYKHLIDKEGLESGSLFNLGSHDYPLPLIRIAENIMEGVVYERPDV